MQRSPLFAAFLLGLALAWAPRAMAATPAPEDLAATAITLEGEVSYEDGGNWEPVALGQLLGAGDQVRTGESSSLHLVLADGSSLVLGPNTEATLKDLGPGGPGSSTVITLLKGLLNAMVEKLGPDASFEVQTGNAVAAVKGTDFEVSTASDDTAVTVAEGTVQLGDAGRRRFEPVHPNERRRFALNRMLAAETLSKRDLGEFRGRWERAHSFHQQRHELLKNLRAQNAKERRRFIRALKQRREARAARRENWKDKHANKAKKRRHRPD